MKGIRDGVRFKNYVGVIQIGGLTIEKMVQSSLQGKKTNDIIHKALDILDKLEHRGAVSEALQHTKVTQPAIFLHSTILFETEVALKAIFSQNKWKN